MTDPAKLDFRDPEWVAETLNIDKNAVYRYLNEGRLPGLQLGRKWLISESSLHEFLKAEEKRQTTARARATASGEDAYTDDARLVLSLAQDEAAKLNHNYIGTEHILLGLIAHDGPASALIQSAGLDLPAAVAAVEKAVGRGEETVDTPGIGLTPAADRAVRGAIAEARDLGADVAGPEHLLLALYRPGISGGIGGKILATTTLTRDSVLATLTPEGT